MKAVIVIAVFCVLGTARADWTATVLHPAEAGRSDGHGACGAKQAGDAWIGGGPKAALWSGSAGSFVNLNPTGAINSSCDGAYGNQQVGYFSTSEGFFACRWAGTAASFVNLHPSAVSGSFATSGYDTHQVGYTNTTGLDDHAALWSGTAASWVDLNPAGASKSHARSGWGTHQVGDAQFGSVTQAVMWSGTAASVVSLHPSGATYSSAYGASETTQVGVVQFTGSNHAAVWSGTAASVVDLNPAGASFSYANAVLGNIQVGDYSPGSSVTHACLWTGTAASMVDLHSKLPAEYSTSQCNAIGSDGINQYIVGTAYNSNTHENEAVVWSRSVPTFEYTLTLNKASVAGQNSVQGTITLGSSDSSATVFTTYDNSSLVTTPPTVTVPANNLFKNFQITVMAVTSPINTTIYAKFGATVKSQPLTLAPLIPTALSFTPNPVVGSHPTTGKVVINGVAGPGGRVIALLDNSSYSTVPNSVTVPPGASSVTFNITTKAVPAVQSVTVTARVTAGEKTGTFRINP